MITLSVFLFVVYIVLASLVGCVTISVIRYLHKKPESSSKSYILTTQFLDRKGFGYYVNETFCVSDDFDSLFNCVQELADDDKKDYFYEGEDVILDSDMDKEGVFHACYYVGREELPDAVVTYIISPIDRIP